MEAIRLWHLLALVLAALLVVAAAHARGADVPEEEDEEATNWDTESEEPWASSGSGSRSRLLLATKAAPKCYKSNCAKNDTNVAACKQQARDQKKRSIQCCKYNQLHLPAPLNGPILYFQPSGCVDLASQASYCGSCTTVCRAGQICCRGACVDTCCDGACPAGAFLTCCANKCTDVRSDAANCGGCGLVCAADEACCSGFCTRILIDEVNCGSCGQNCLDRCCNGVCKYTYTDPNSCGGCALPTGEPPICPPDRRICCDGGCYNSTPDFTCVG